jgi:hypothetical protein
MAIAKLWTDALSNASVYTSDAAERNIRRLSSTGGIALREACILYALSNAAGRSREGYPDASRVERLTGINSSACYFTLDSLACRGLVRLDRDDGKQWVLTDNGKALLGTVS